MRLTAFSLLLLLSLASCSDEFTLEAPWKDIPVVYGYPSIQDEVVYIRIEKAFLQSGGDATEIARLADSLYYGPDQITASLVNLSNGKSAVLERINAESVGLDRQDGIFADSPNILYRAFAGDLDLRGGNRVRLVIERQGNLPPAVAETTLLGKIEPRESRPSDPARIAEYGRPLNISWSAGEEASVFDVRLIMHLREFFPDDPSLNRERTLEWVVARAFTPTDNNSLKTLTVLNEEFFQFLGSNLEERDDVIRVFDGFDIQVAGGGAELAEFLRIANANIGLTSSQQVPVYTNIEEGRGIFTSRYVALREAVNLDNVSLDTLRQGIYTRNLNFQ